MPVYAGILIFFSLASLGLRDFRVCQRVPDPSRLIPVFQADDGLAAIGILLAATYLLYMIQRILLGKLNPKWSSLPDINYLELSTLVPLMIFILGIGLYPKIILDYMIPTLDGLLKTMGGAV